MTLVLRLITLLTIGAAGFAMPATCAQGAPTMATRVVSVAVPVSHQLAKPAVDPDHFARGQRAAHDLGERFPANCGKTAPRVGDHPAALATDPFVPGYLDSALVRTEEQPRMLVLPPAATLADSRAGPPDAPPPRPVR